jgi:hypothetical protein
MKKIIVIIFAGLMTASCHTGPIKYVNSSMMASATAHPEAVNNMVIFKVNGREIKTSGWTISRVIFKGSKEWLNVTTNMNEDKRTINVNIAGTVPGTYKFEANAGIEKNSYGSFYPDYLDDLANSYSFTWGSFTITSIDTVQRTVNADFFGIVKNLKGETLEITGGKIINGTLNIGVTRY